MKPTLLLRIDMNPPITLKIRDFESKILYFNGMYKLPIAPYPSVAAVQAKEPIAARLTSFKKTLLDEVEEVDALIAKMEVDSSYKEIDLLTDLADWLGDIQVYCASEMAKFGLPLKEVLTIIMDSNFSKLGADGLPIYNEDGKVMKGPMYWKPEPQIKQFLQERIAESTIQSTKVYDTDMDWKDSEIRGE